MKQQGFINTQLAVGVLVMSVLAATYATLSRSNSLEKLAYNSGKEAGQVNNAIRSYIAQNANTIPSGVTQYSNIAWLKSRSDCGGSATGDNGFLPCDFPDKLPLGLTYEITLNKSDDEIASSIELGIPNDSVENIPYLSGQVVTGAKGSSVMNSDPDLGNVYFDAYDDRDGQVVLTASNQPGMDQYLRIDGSTQPTGDFNWAGRSIHNISGLSAKQINAEEITASGKVVAKEFIDLDNPDYNILLSGLSKMNSLNVSENVKADTIHLSGRYRAGESCDTNGILSLDHQYNLLVCRNEFWASVGEGDNFKSWRVVDYRERSSTIDKYDKDHCDEQKGIVIPVSGYGWSSSSSESKLRVVDDGHRFRVVDDGAWSNRRMLNNFTLLLLCKR